MSEPSRPGHAASSDNAVDSAVIRRLWPDGCFTLRDVSGAVYESDHERCARPRRPYSTFKLANALIGLDAGVLEGADAKMTWDKRAIPDDPSFLEIWRQPHTLRTGITVSAVPYFRTLALQIGEPRMHDGLAKLAYGNQDMSGGLDRFWLSGGLRISAAQQLAFVDALARGTLRVAEQAQAAVREVSALEHAGASVLHGKTGAGPIENGTPGWLVWQVGWIERGETIVSYACWLETATGAVTAARVQRDERLRTTLAATGVFSKSGQ